ncbi:MAG: hypothetical protein LAO20_12550 [Acidobacteriia bacterium]|nr:hypothetical protein [Terriglobia bacterium]
MNDHAPPASYDSAKQFHGTGFKLRIYFAGSMEGNRPELPQVKRVKLSNQRL